LAAEIIWPARYDFCKFSPAYEARNAGTSRVLGDICPVVILKMMIFVADWRFAWFDKHQACNHATINLSGFKT
jgi:hypothetical protein